MGGANRAGLVSTDAADRVAEAAQLLLDAARGADAESPSFQKGEERVTTVMALAVQALLLADEWRPGDQGQTRPLDKGRTLKRLTGLGTGLGVSLSALPEPGKTVGLIAMQFGLRQGLEDGAAIIKARKS